MSAVFGDSVVDMYGNIESAKDFVNEDHNIEHATTKVVAAEIEQIEGGGEV